MKRFFLGLTVLAGLSLFSCSNESKNGDTIENTNNKSEQDGKEGLIVKLKPMIPADVENKVLLSMKPTKEDIEYLFNSEEAVEKVAKYIDRMYNTLPATALKPGNKRTEILVFNQDTDVLKTEKDENLPGGLHQIADNFKRGRMIYAVKFVEPGSEVGFATNCFVYINDRWVCFPKIYRAFI